MTTRNACPTCGREMDPAVVVRHTGEFTVPSFPEHDSIGVAPAVAPRAAAPGPVTCTWCGKDASEVRKLLSGPGVQICDECISLCYRILKDELPDFP